MSFVGPVSRLGGRLVRPHNVTISLQAGLDTIEAMVSRVIHLGFEVRVEVQQPDGHRVDAQITRDQAAQLELEAGDIVYVRPPLAAPVTVERAARSTWSASASSSGAAGTAAESSAARRRTAASSPASAGRSVIWVGEEVTPSSCAHLGINANRVLLYQV